MPSYRDEAARREYRRIWMSKWRKEYNKYVKTGRSKGHRGNSSNDYLGTCTECQKAACNCKVCLTRKGKSNICFKCFGKETENE